MRAVVQRVTSASVTIEGEVFASIRQGVLVLVGIEDNDSIDDGQWLAAKISNMRIFDDEKGVMNKSVSDVHGEALVISQFTLFASTKKGNRPSYIKAGKPEYASKMYEIFCRQISSEMSRPAKTGIFAAHMIIQSVNDGPVTILIDSKARE
ncbi:MAG: D-aminoacyl-tRNA deacylase [Bacteroidia bacterium]